MHGLNTEFYRSWPKASRRLHGQTSRVTAQDIRSRSDSEEVMVLKCVYYLNLSTTLEFKFKDGESLRFTVPVQAFAFIRCTETSSM